MVGQGKLMKQQSVYFILKQLSNNNFEYKKFNFLVEKVFKIAHMYIFHNMTRIPSSTTDGHSNKDHAIEAISELFIKNKNNSYPICNSFNNWRPSISNEDETLFFLYKVTSSRVEQYITKSLKEADPISAKILDALNYVIKKSSYKKKHILGKKFICNSENKDLELQIISADDLQLIPSHYFQNTNKIFENLFNYFGENSESYTAIPINALAARIKQIHSSLHTHEFTPDIIESSIFVDDVIRAGYNSTYSILINSYFLKGKLSEVETEAFKKTLKDLAKDIANGGINPGLFNYFKRHMNSISEEDYLIKYHNKLEYLLKVMRKNIKSILENTELVK